MLELTLDIGASLCDSVGPSAAWRNGCPREGGGAASVRRAGQAHQLRNDSGEPLGGVEARICDEPKRVGPALCSRRVLASLPVSELSNDLFPQRGRKRLLARDHAGL